jgi:hypothetical protein
MCNNDKMDEQLGETGMIVVEHASNKIANARIKRLWENFCGWTCMEILVKIMQVGVTLLPKE